MLQYAVSRPGLFQDPWVSLARVRGGATSGVRGELQTFYISLEFGAHPLLSMIQPAFSLPRFFFLGLPGGQWLELHVQCRVRLILVGG